MNEKHTLESLTELVIFLDNKLKETNKIIEDLISPISSKEFLLPDVKDLDTENYIHMPIDLFTNTTLSISPKEKLYLAFFMRCKDYKTLSKKLNKSNEYVLEYVHSIRSKKCMIGYNVIPTFNPKFYTNIPFSFINSFNLSLSSMVVYFKILNARKDYRGYFVDRGMLKTTLKLSDSQLPRVLIKLEKLNLIKKVGKTFSAIEVVDYREL